jgi:hypothetical protein
VCHEILTSAFNNFYPETTIKLQPLVSAFNVADPDLDPHHFGKSDPDPQQSEKSDPIRSEVKSGTQIRIKVQIQELWRLKMVPWRLTLEP